MREINENRKKRDLPRFVDGVAELEIREEVNVRVDLVCFWTIIQVPFDFVNEIEAVEAHCTTVPSSVNLSVTVMEVFIVIDVG